MAMRAPIQLAEIRARKADRRSEPDELRMEIRAAGQEMVAMSNRLINALLADDIRAASHYAHRLGHVGQGYANYSDDGGNAA